MGVVRITSIYHWIQSSMEAILLCHQAVSTEWLDGWQIPVYYDVCARPPFSSIRKPCTCTSISDTALAGRKFIADESSRTPECKTFTLTKISAFTETDLKTYWEALDTIDLLPNYGPSTSKRYRKPVTTGNTVIFNCEKRNFRRSSDLAEAKIYLFAVLVTVKLQIFVRYLFSYFRLETGSYVLIFVLSRVCEENDVEIQWLQSKKKFSYDIKFRTFSKVRNVRK